MKTIAEKLQIIADNISAIKQSIRNKGGDVSGDITTWSSAINNIESSSENINNVYVSTNNTYKMDPTSKNVDVFCSFEKPLDFDGIIQLTYISDMTVMTVKTDQVHVNDTEYTFKDIIMSETFMHLASVLLIPFDSAQGRKATDFVFKYNYL